MGVHDPRGAADASPRGSPPPSARSATSPTGCPTPRASTCSATTPTGCSTSAPRATCADGCAPTSPPPRPAPGWARWCGSPRRVTAIECATPLEAEVRELRLIAQHKPSYNRRSQFPEKVTFVKLTREPWPRLSLVHKVLDDDADYLGPFSLAHQRREVPGRAARHVPGAPVLRPVRPATVPQPPACSPRWAAACRRATAASTSTPTPPSSASCARPCCAVPTTSSTSSTPGWPRSPPTSGSRRPASTATGWPPSSGPPPAPSGSPRSPTAPRSSPRRREDDGRWAVHVVRYGRLAAAGVIPSGADAHALRRPAARHGRDRAAPRRHARPGAGRHGRGDRAGAALARGAPTCAWSTSTASGPARSPARPASSRVTRVRAGAVRRRTRVGP